MAAPLFLDMYADDICAISGDSLTGGDRDASVKLPRGLRPLIRQPYQRADNGLARMPGARLPCVTMYDMGAPYIVESGNAGDPIQIISGDYFARVGTHNPNIVIMGAGANNTGDATPGIFDTRVDALVTAITTPSSYNRGKIPEGWLWWGCAWRGSETPGGTNQPELLARNAVIKTKVEAAGGIFVDVQAAWLALKPIPPPNTFTIDLTHFTQAGCDFVSALVMAKIRLHPEIRG